MKREGQRDINVLVGLWEDLSSNYLRRQVSGEEVDVYAAHLLTAVIPQYMSSLETYCAFGDKRSFIDPVLGFLAKAERKMLREQK